LLFHNARTGNTDTDHRISFADAKIAAGHEGYVFRNIAEDNQFAAAETVAVCGSGSNIEHSMALAEIIKTTAFKVTKVGQLIGTEVAEKMNLPFGVADLSLAPTPEVGDSVGEIFQSVGLSSIGAPGSTAVLAMLNDAVKKGGVFASSSVGGLSGAFIPVSEDAAIADAASKGLLTLEKLEAMTCVCSVGLDMIAIPGDTPADVISAIIADESAIGMINAKTTAVRLIPVPGKTVGERAEFGGLLGGADIMAVQKGSAAGFINRGGRIPAPIHSFKN